MADARAPPARRVSTDLDAAERSWLGCANPTEGEPSDRSESNAIVRLAMNGVERKPDPPLQNTTPPGTIAAGAKSDPGDGRRGRSEDGLSEYALSRDRDGAQRKAPMERVSPD